jgi:CheY-like chemotaxis protein
VAVFAAAGLEAQDAVSKRDQMIAHIERGRQFRAWGRLVEAKAAFEAAIALGPSSEDALVIRERIGIEDLLRLWGEEQFRKEIQVILDRSLERSEELAKDTANTQKYVDMLKSEDSREVWKAIHALRRIGPYAVPHLLDAISIVEVKERYSPPVSARIAIKMMGPRAVPALAQALKARTQPKDPNAAAEAAKRDLNLKVTVCSMLGEARDRRGLPYMTALAMDEKAPKTLREAARAAAGQILAGEGASVQAAASASLALPRVNDAFFDLASRYVMYDPRLTVLVPSYERLVWRWKEGPETIYTGKLVFEQPADYLYPLLSAQQLLLDSLEVTDDDPRLLGLYVATNYMLYNTAAGTARHPKATEAERAKSAEATKALAYVHELNEQLGARYLYLAMQRGLEANDTSLVLSCIAGLRALRDARRLAESQVLRDAVRHTSREVRTAAAEAILWISPDGAFCPTDEEAHRVVGGVYELLASGGKSRMLVITQSQTLYEGVAAHAKGWNIQTELSPSGAEGMERARQPLPPIDVILVDSQLQYHKIEDFLATLRKDVRTAHLPVLVTCPQKLAKEVAARLKVEPVPYDDQGKVAPPVLQKIVETALAGNRSERQKVDDAMMRRALVSLAWVPKSTKYPVKTLQPVLIELLTNQPAGVSAVSLEVLGGLGDAQALPAVARVFLDAKAAKDLRVRAGKAAAEMIALVESPDAEMVQRLQDEAAGKDDDLRVLAVRILAKANIPQSKREDVVLRVAKQRIQ